AYGNGGGGIGAAASAGCGAAPGVEVRAVDAHDNVAGIAAGGAAWVHDSDVHDNAAGMTAAFACPKLEHNRVHANNQNFFTVQGQQLCSRTAFAARAKETVCPHVAVPVGPGIVMSGADPGLGRANF